MPYEIKTLDGDCRDCGTLPAAHGTRPGPRLMRETCGPLVFLLLRYARLWRLGWRGRRRY
jgi:hypothetical protein